MNQIVSIQILRAIAALAIVIAHALADAETMGRNLGADFKAPDWPLGAGVDLFFVISGVVMVIASRNLFGQPGASWIFFSRRITRIVPIYWLVTTLFLIIVWLRPEVLNSPFPSLIDIIKSYSFVPYFREAENLVQPIYKLGWTLNYEMMFYACFALLVVMPMQRAVMALTLLFAGLVAIGFVLSPGKGALQFWTAPIILEFVAGTWVGLIFLRGVRISAMAGAGLAIAGGFLLVLAAPFYDDSNWLVRLLCQGIPAMIVTAGCVLGFANIGSGSAFVRLLVLLGDASYALYLFHPFAVRFFRLVWERTGFAAFAGPWGYVAMTTISASIAAVIIYKFVEIPLTRRAQAALSVGRRSTA